MCGLAGFWQLLGGAQDTLLQQVQAMAGMGASRPVRIAMPIGVS